MISERVFSASYGAMWHELIPSAENFVRYLNLGAHRFAAPISSKAQSLVNGVANETAFRLCRRAFDLARTGGAVMQRSDCAVIWLEVCAWLGVDASAPAYHFSEDIWSDVQNIASNLHTYISRNNPSQIEFDPEFKGCGVLSRCNGDLIIKNILIEVKAGQRPFRSTDLRQLFTYCALERAAGKSEIRAVGLVNPRRGVFWVGEIEETAVGCGALSSIDLFDEIVKNSVMLGASR